ncbi:MAG: hypothetical protein II767_01360 [Proteobacteria bacterium]|nr:hypothetical protein [Pseudomonadota bacterium]
MNKQLCRFLAFFAVFMSFATAVMMPVDARADDDRFSAGGYFRIGARPDFQGGYSKLGLWNISGRLLNETQWAALDMRLQLLKQTPGTDEIWTSLHAKIEGGSAHGADLLNGALGAFSLTQLYVRAGNIGSKDIIWQVGTLDFYFGDLGLYDMKFAEIFYDTVGASLTWSTEKTDLLVGIGDSGYLKNYQGYSPVLTAGAALRVRPKDGVEFGVGGEFMYAPAVEANTNSPHQTRYMPQYADGTANVQLRYEDYLRHEVISTFAQQVGESDFLNRVKDVRPDSVDAFSFKLVGYLGFGKLGALKWNNLFFNFLRQHPEQFYEETYQPKNASSITKRIYVSEWTDERYQFNLGDEMNLEIVKNRFDLTWAALLGYHFDKDDKISASERNRLIWSAVVRGQIYFTPVTHLLIETSFAQEKSLNGNLWRSNADSIWRNTNGVMDARGLEYGDLDVRNTWQGKLGVVLNPTGVGIFSRPSLRFMYGIQYSNAHNAFASNNLSEEEELLNYYGTQALQSGKDNFGPTRHFHHVLSLEAEAWF